MSKMGGLFWSQIIDGALEEKEDRIGFEISVTRMRIRSVSQRTRNTTRRGGRLDGGLSYHLLS